MFTDISRIGCEAGEVPLHALRAGDEFTLDPSGTRPVHGVLLRVTACSALIWVTDKQKPREIVTGEGQVVALLAAPVGKQYWAPSCPVTPTGTRRDIVELLSHGVKSNSNTGETNMANKKVKAVKAVKEAKKPSLFQAFRSKITGDFAKKIENKEATGHLVVVTQVLLKKDSTMTLVEVADAVKETGRYGPRGKTIAAAKLTMYVRADLNQLVKDGLVKITEQA